MRLLFFLVFIFCADAINATITFQKTYGGPGADCAYYVIETSDYGYAIVGAKERHRRIYAKRLFDTDQ
jgi:hypothetical protein